MATRVVLSNTFFCSVCVYVCAADCDLSEARRLPAETVQRLALALERVHHVHGRHRLAAGVLGVGDRVANDVLEEHLKRRERRQPTLEPRKRRSPRAFSTPRVSS